jgi:hypothetical protein
MASEEECVWRTNLWKPNPTERREGIRILIPLVYRNLAILDDRNKTHRPRLVDMILSRGLQEVQIFEQDEVSHLAEIGRLVRAFGNKFLFQPRPFVEKKLAGPFDFKFDLGRLF